MTNTTITPRIDLSFRLAGKLLPLDHGYALFGAICRVLGDLHGAPWLAVHPVRGLPRQDGTIALDPRRGSLRLRIEPGEIPRVLALAGKRLEVDGYVVQVGVSSVQALAPARALVTRMATIKGYEEPEPFREAALRQLGERGIQGRVEVGRRRVLRVNGKTVVGFGVTLHDLSEEGSLTAQYGGIGGKQRMGCGVMVPVGRGE